MQGYAEFLIVMTVTAGIVQILFHIFSYIAAPLHSSLYTSVNPTSSVRITSATSVVYY